MTPPLDPRDRIAVWLPHLVLMLLILLAVWLLAVVFRPVIEPIVLAASLALLTTHVLYLPIDRALARALPRLRPEPRMRVAGLLATAALVVAVLLPVLLVLASLTGGFEGLFQLLWGVISKDPEQLDRLRHGIEDLVAGFDRLYPALDLPQREIPLLVIGAIERATALNRELMGFFFTGTGALAQMLLALVLLAFLYPNGPRLVGGLLAWSPLDEAHKERLLRRHRHVVLRLLNDSLGTALCRGVAFGLVAWLVDRSLGTGLLPIVPVMLMAALISLLPLVGSAMVWLPLAAYELTAETGGWVAATAMTLGCIAADLLVLWLRHRLGRHLDEKNAWVGFLLFLGLIGGLLSFGAKGFIIGPMSVVIAYTLFSFWLPHYGVGREVETDNEDFDRRGVEDSERTPSGV